MQKIELLFEKITDTTLYYCLTNLFNMAKTELYLYPANASEVADVMKEARSSSEDADVYTGPECAICYKRIQKDVFICSEPCNKLFHPSCLERMMDETELTAYQYQKDTLHRCCYCRREIQMETYLKEVYVNALMKMKAGGYNVDEALQLIEMNGINEDEGYAIYLLTPTEHIKKPKQAKKTKSPKHYVKIQRKNVMHHKMGCGVRKR